MKQHKVNLPLRPIVTSVDSPLCITSKFFSKILSPLQNQNGFLVTNSTQFRNEISMMTISEDWTMVSFLIDKACTYIRIKLENDDTLSDRTQIYRHRRYLMTVTIYFILQFFRLQRHY